MNIFKSTSLAVGESVTIIVNDVATNKFGTVNYLGMVDGVESEIRPSGNLKFLADDLKSGKRNYDTAYTLTRTADKQIKGYNVTQFSLNPVDSAAPAAKVASVTDKLNAIRAKRATTQNS